MWSISANSSSGGDVTAGATVETFESVGLAVSKVVATGWD
jgi:hypothetical protein